MKKIISLITIIALLCSTVALAHPFKDTAGHWANDELEKAYTNGVISGDGDGRFRPDDTVSRAEFVKMLVADICARFETEIPAEFDDQTHWAAKYYNFGQAAIFRPLEEEIDGITAGVMTKESYDIPVTRWEMAYLLTEAMSNVAGLYSGNTAIATSDAQEIQDSYPQTIVAAIANCQDMGLMVGDETNKFNAKDSGTRAEAVTVINRIDAFLKMLLDEYNATLTEQQKQQEAYEQEVKDSQITYDEIPAGHPVVTILMSNNQKIMLELYPEYAPQTVANFVKLIKDGFYDGLTFHRIVDGFVAQGGDPNGDGSGGSDGCIKGEFAANGFDGNTLSHTKGVISMARSQSFDSASSQFFICLDDATFLDGQYAAFGKVLSGMPVLEKYAKGEMQLSSSGEYSIPAEPVVMKKVVVTVKK